MTLATLFLIVALILFVLATCGINSGKASLVAAGLACCVLSVLASDLSMS